MFGSATVAAFSAASRIHMLTEQAANSFGTAMATLPDRITALPRSAGFGRVFRNAPSSVKGLPWRSWYRLCCSAAQCPPWFIDGYHPEVVGQAHLYLFIAALFYPVLTLLFLYRNTLLGLGNRVTPCSRASASCCPRMIGAPVLGHFFGFAGLCWINPIAWVTATLLLFLSLL